MATTDLLNKRQALLAQREIHLSRIASLTSQLNEHEQALSEIATEIAQVEQELNDSLATSSLGTKPLTGAIK